MGKGLLLHPRRRTDDDPWCTLHAGDSQGRDVDAAASRAVDEAELARATAMRLNARVNELVLAEQASVGA